MLEEDLHRGREENDCDASAFVLVPILVLHQVQEGHGWQG